MLVWYNNIGAKQFRYQWNNLIIALVHKLSIFCIRLVDYIRSNLLVDYIRSDMLVDYIRFDMMLDYIRSNMLVDFIRSDMLVD